MDNRETIIEFVRKLPASMSLVEIAREVELLAGVHSAREQAKNREGVSAEDVRKLAQAWRK